MQPMFLWDRLLRLFFGVGALVVLVLFWIGAVLFTLGNVAIAWHRLWRYFGVWNLVVYRFIMRMRNLYDTSRLVLAGRSDPRHDPSLRWDPRYQYQRTVDGSFNDLSSPCMGRAGMPFGRNVPPNRLSKPDRTSILGDLVSPGNPTPREVSRVLLTRDRFRPATSLNVLAAAWIQFQVHDWFGHKRQLHDPLKIRLREEDNYPHATDGYMHVRLNEEIPADQKVSADELRRADFPQDLPIYANTESHWWDASQIYGSTQARQDLVRDRAGGLGKLKLSPNGRLLQEPDPDLPGFELTGSNDNWWVGLSLLHTLFAREHNAICDALHEAYPQWDDERLFQMARLINAMLLAKIHTIEWTPAILGHPTLFIGMRSNWYGILGRFNKILSDNKYLTHIQEELTGIPGSATDHHAAPYCMTEEFAAVYRLHPLIPDHYRVYDSRSDEFLEELTFEQIHGNDTRPLVDRIGMEDLFYSFGTAYPGAVTLHNFPRALQNFTRIKDPGGAVLKEPLDLGTVDVFRDRERAVPRYNFFRCLLFRLPQTSYHRLVGLPLLLPSLSRLSRRERRERLQWVEELKALYGPNNFIKQFAHYCGYGSAQGIDRVDTMVGLTAETPPKGFGFSDTAFRVFVLMASRRLKSDRFFTEGYKPDVYTDIGMKWIENNNLKSVIQRHYPSLSAALVGVENPFAPWRRAEEPLPEPAAVHPFTFSVMPILAGIVAGALVGWLTQIFSTWHGIRHLPASALASAFSWRTLGGMLLGYCIGAFCQIVIHFIDNWLGRRLTAGGLLAIVNSCIVGGLLYGRFYLSRPVLPDADTFLGRFTTDTTLMGAGIGTAIGFLVVGLLTGLVRLYDSWQWGQILPHFRRPVAQWAIPMILFACLGLLAGASMEWIFNWVQTLQGGGAAQTELPTGISSTFGSGALAPPHGLVGASIGAAAGMLFAVPVLRRISLGLSVGMVMGWLLGVLSAILSSPAFRAAEMIDASIELGFKPWAVLCGLVIAIAVALDRGLLTGIPAFLAGWCVVVVVALASKAISDVSVSQYISALNSPQAMRAAAAGGVLGILLTLFVWQARWRLRRFFWDIVAFLKFRTSKPLIIDIPSSRTWAPEEASLPESFGLTSPHASLLNDIRSVKSIPQDEKTFRRTRYLLKCLIFPLQRWAYRWLSPMQPELPVINADAHTALNCAYRGLRKGRFDAPVLPPEFEGSPDLGSLAVRSPYACYLKQSQDGITWEWDLGHLEQYEYRKGLYNLGVKVTFRQENRRLREQSITTNETGECLPDQPGWPFAKKLALCAISNHISLVRHWNWVHLTPAASLAMATRAHFDSHHPLSRLLWPHVFGTIQSNKFGNMAQLSEEGDFEAIFSFTQRGLYQLLADTYREYDFGITDPRKDAISRGIRQAPFLTPMQANLELLFDQFLAHTRRYVQIYYPDGTLLATLHDPNVAPQTKKEIEAIVDWLNMLNRLIPSGAGYHPESLTRDELAHLLARFIYLVSALHETVGSALWNYQLWVHRQPVRLYKDGRREPLDVYQRLVNFNYMLNVDRTPLMADYSRLALPGREEHNAKAAFQAFQSDLARCEQEMRKEPWAVWKIYPSELEAHINA
jgi:hypothetical protein